MSLARPAAAAWLLALALAAGSAHALAPSVSAGGTHSLAIRADGSLRAWGDDSAGALGTGRSLQTLLPLAVNGISNVTQVACGDFHTVALRSDGTVWAWGRNDHGELGDGTTHGRSTPAPVAGLSGVIAIAAGSVHTVALKSDGTVWTWGANYVGQLGDGSDGRSTPAQVGALANVRAISAGYEHTVALVADGTVWAWGKNDDGQLGNGTVSPRYSGVATPVQVVGLSGIAQVAAGGTHTLARTSDGAVWAWGDNSGGNLGNGTTTSSTVPVAVPALGPVAFIAAGSYSLAIKADGSAWAWGANGYGQLGDGTYVDRLAPVPLTALPPLQSAALAFLHSSAVARDGSVWSWGNNDNGALGDGTTDRHGTPLQAHGIAGASQVAVGESFTVALKADGSVWAWGDNGSGQLGSGVAIFATTPTLPTDAAGWTAAAAGGRHSIALKADGSVLAAGHNAYGQLGDGTRVSRATFAPVTGLAGVTEISAGYYHSLARKGDGSVWAWGLDYAGRLGTGPDGDPDLVPLQVPGLSDVVHVSAGGDHSLALRADGSVWAWGSNNAGQLGDGTTVTRDMPVRVTGLPNVVEIAAGADHSLARASDGSVWAWGGNYQGQLGDGTNVDRAVPLRVNGLQDVVAISAGGTVSAARTREGNVWMWGANFDAQLGDGTYDQRTTPERLPDLAGVARISVGNAHTLALASDGTVLAWGRNDYGQLGDGTLAARGSGVAVVREGGAGSLAANDWFLDLDPAIAKAPRREPVFLAVASNVNDALVADIRFRAQDQGRSGSVYVFALAPATLVKDGLAAKSMVPGSHARATTTDAPVPCVLAQLNASGQLQAVGTSGLQAYLTGTLSAQGQAVTILNTAASAQAAGATFYVGYGSDPASMVANGTNRSVVSVPGSAACQPQAPQTGWWWNPLESGRGFAIEARGNNLFFGAFLYDASGRSTWTIAAGPASLDGSYFSGDLLEARGGQTLGGAYPGSPSIGAIGAVTLAFNDATHGMMVWPGGTVAIERMAFGPGGPAPAAAGGQPESGWWWNPAESGRGFFMEWQGATLDVAGFMYDDAGSPVWYLSAGPMDATGGTYSSQWWSFADGQTLTGAYRQNRLVSDHVAPVTIRFSGPDAALMTLPNGRTTALTRQRF